MRQKELSRWLKVLLTISAGICAFLAFAVVPSVAGDLAAASPAHAHLKLPFELYIWASIIPVCAALALAWRIAGEIARDNSFSRANASRLRIMCLLGLGELAYYFVGLVGLFLLRLLSFRIAISVVMIIFFCLVFTVVTALLSHLVRKATDIKDENDLTV